MQVTPQGRSPKFFGRVLLWILIAVSMSDEARPQGWLMPVEDSTAPYGSTPVVQATDALADDPEADGSQSPVDRGARKAASKSDNPVKLTLQGRIHLDQWYFVGDDRLINTIERGDPALSPFDRWLVRRARLEASADIGEVLFAKMDVEFSDPQSTEFRDLFIGWKLNDNRRLRLGNMKRPISLESLNGSNDLLFLERPTISDTFNDEVRRAGIQITGYTDDLRWTYAAGGFFLDVFQGDGEWQGNAWQAQFAGRVTETYWYDEASDGADWGHWGLSFAVADPTSDRDLAAEPFNRFRTRDEVRSTRRWIETQRFDIGTYQNLGLEAALNVGPLLVQGEAIATPVQRVGDSDLLFWGYYVQTHYFLTGEHQPWNRETGTYRQVRPRSQLASLRGHRDDCDASGAGWGAWGIGFRYSYIDLSDQDIIGGEGHTASAILNWWMHRNARLSLEYVADTIRDPAAGVNGTFGLAQTHTIGARLLTHF
jgi:phosphate-selective porin OprO/OprP